MAKTFFEKIFSNFAFSKFVYRFVKNPQIMKKVFSACVNCFLIFLLLLHANHILAQPPGTLTIIDKRICEDTLFLAVEAEPLGNPPCGGPFMGNSLTSFTNNVYTYDYTLVSAPVPVRWIAVSFFPTQAPGCNI